MVHSLAAGADANEPALLSATPAAAAIARLAVTAVLAAWAWSRFRRRPLV